MGVVEAPMAVRHQGLANAGKMALLIPSAYPGRGTVVQAITTISNDYFGKRDTCQGKGCGSFTYVHPASDGMHYCNPCANTMVSRGKAKWGTR